ncbi:hypothetical protein Q3G72_025894 [Acer saccharum]|nr:hypothetical protein Q3G72_025894 [Acer saccharum]
MVNGMHVYGWPITAKLADFDWNKRRNLSSGGVETGWPYRKFKTEKLVRRDRYESKHRPLVHQDNRSFVEVVKEDKNGIEGRTDVQIRRTHRLNWSGDKEIEVEDWLSCIAIGKLKVFDCFDQVNRNLEDRGIEFTSSYMGGNFIAWTFGSNYDRDGFINNGFLWRNCFSSMMEWKEGWMNDSKLIWVDIYGVPLSCWCKSFFTSLGGIVGVTMWIDEETVHKSRLDRGRILLLLALDKVVPPEILVKSGNRDFRVRLEESLIPVSSDWLSRRLGLKSGLKIKLQQVDDGGECREASGVGEWGLVRRRQEKPDRVEGTSSGPKKSSAQNDIREAQCQYTTQFEKEKVGRRLSSDRSPFPKTVGQTGAGRVGALDKGKEGWVQNLKSNPARRPSHKGGIRIGVGREDILSQSSDDSSSSGEDIGRGVFKRGCGETSFYIGPSGPKAGGLNKEGHVRKDPISFNPLDKEGLLSPMGIRVESSSQLGANCAAELEIEEGASSSSADLSEKEEGSKVNLGARVLNAQERELAKGIKLCIDLREQKSGSSSQLSGGCASPSVMGDSQDTVVGETLMEDSRGKWLPGDSTESGKGTEGCVRSNPKKSRSSIPKPSAGNKKVKWHIGNEIARVIEKGVARGLARKARRQRILEGIEEGEIAEISTPSWVVDEEVAKIMETGVALGFDFNGNETEVSQVLRTMEKEDEARIKQ